MKTKIITFFSLVILGLGSGLAQNNTIEQNNFQFGEAEHFLDGYSLNFQYQSGGAIHMEFKNGKAKYQWLTGPKKGKGNSNISYKSRKIGKNLYLVNWHETGIKDYLTIVFDLEKMIVHSSIIVGYENKPERPLKTVFKSGIIDHLKKAE